MLNLPLKFTVTPYLNGKGVARRSSYFICLSTQRGSAVFYVLIAIAMLGMLTFAFMNDSGTNTVKQNAYQISEQLYNQFNTINSAVLQCILEYPKGGGDLDGNSYVDANDNNHRPYPLTPSNANNPGGAAADDQARNMKCPGSGNGIFQGSGNIGTYLPPPPSEFSEWEYFNTASGVTGGVYLRTIGSASSTATEAVRLLQQKFDSSQFTTNYNACGANCIVIWIKKD